MDSSDTVIIGAGINSLVAAAMLSVRGTRVLALIHPADGVDSDSKSVKRPGA